MKITLSTDPKDINKVMEVVKTFGANQEQLTKIESYINNELLELGTNRLLFLLTNKNKTIGIVQLIVKNADSDLTLANDHDIAHVHALQISKRYHRKGHACMLMSFLENYAKKQGINKLTLGVDQDNPKAIALYEKLDYKILKEVEGREPNVKLYYLYKDLL